jgi:hypothetical protein
MLVVAILGLTGGLGLAGCAVAPPAPPAHASAAPTPLHPPTALVPPNSSMPTVLAPAATAPLEAPAFHPYYAPTITPGIL